MWLVSSEFISEPFEFICELDFALESSFFLWGVHVKPSYLFNSLLFHNDSQIHSSARTKAAQHFKGFLPALGSPNPPAVNQARCSFCPGHSFPQAPTVIQEPQNRASQSLSVSYACPVPPATQRAFSLLMRHRPLVQAELHSQAETQSWRSHLGIKLLPGVTIQQQLGLSISSGVRSMLQCLITSSFLIRELAMRLYERTQFAWCIQEWLPKKAQKREALSLEFLFS